MLDFYTIFNIAFGYVVVLAVVAFTTLGCETLYNFANRSRASFDLVWDKLLSETSKNILITCFVTMVVVGLISLIGDLALARLAGEMPFWKQYGIPVWVFILVLLPHSLRFVLDTSKALLLDSKTGKSKRIDALELKLQEQNQLINTLMEKGENNG